jgi:hypothetical protein
MWRLGSFGEIQDSQRAQLLDPALCATHQNLTNWVQLEQNGNNVKAVVATVRVRSRLVQNQVPGGMQ